MERLSNLSKLTGIPSLTPQIVQSTAIGYKSWDYSVINPTFPLTPTTQDFSFELKPCPQSVIIPKQSWIKLVIQASRTDDLAFDGDDEVSFSNLAAILMWSNVNIECLGVDFETKHSYAHIINYLHCMTSYSEVEKLSILRGAGYEPDDLGQTDISDPYASDPSLCACLKCNCTVFKDIDTKTKNTKEEIKTLQQIRPLTFNEGLWKRSFWCFKGQKKEFWFPLYLLSAFWGMEILLPAKCPYTVTLRRHEDKKILIQKGGKVGWVGGTKSRQRDYKLAIKELQLYIAFGELESSIRSKWESLIIDKPLTCQVPANLIIKLPVKKQSISYRQADVFGFSRRPTVFKMLMIEEKIESGDFKPINAFKSFGLRSIKLFVNHKGIRQNVFTSKFNLSPNCADYFMLYNMFLNCHSEKANCITPVVWKHDLPLFCINLTNLTSDLLTIKDKGHLALSTFCNIDMELEFENPLPEDIFVFCISSYENLFTMNNEGHFTHELNTV